MTSQTPESDTRAETLGRINYEAGVAKALEQGDDGWFDDWEQVDARDRERCEAGAVAVAAHVANPTAGDFDNAAEIMRLRSALERIADPDADVLDARLGGGDQEELHVRTNLARQALGLDVCGCTECCMSLGIAQEDRG
jgi:hypothetical protein